MQDERHAPVGDRRMPVEAEQFLHPHGEDRAFLRPVVDRDPRAGRHLEMGRRLAVEPALEVPGNKGAQGFAQPIGT